MHKKGIYSQETHLILTISVNYTLKGFAKTTRGSKFKLIFYLTSKRISTGLVKFATMPPLSKVQHPSSATTSPPRTPSPFGNLKTTATISLP